MIDDDLTGRLLDSLREHGAVTLGVDHGHAEPTILLIGDTDRPGVLQRLRDGARLVNVEPPVETIAEGTRRSTAAALLAMAATFPAYPGGPSFQWPRARAAKQPDPVKQSAAEAKRARRRERNRSRRGVTP